MKSLICFFALGFVWTEGETEFEWVQPDKTVQKLKPVPADPQDLLGMSSELRAAVAKAKANNVPLIVVVGASRFECNACVRLKNDLQSSGWMSRSDRVVLFSDDSKPVWKNLSIQFQGYPETLVFKPSATGMQLSKRISGYHSPAAMDAMIFPSVVVHQPPVVQQPPVARPPLQVIQQPRPQVGIGAIVSCGDPGADRYQVNRNQRAYNHALAEARMLANGYRTRRGRISHSGHPMGCAPGCSKAGTGNSSSGRPIHCYVETGWWGGRGLPTSRIVARAVVRRGNQYYWSCHYR